MWIRLIIVLLGIVVMINGCNSLISQNFGTHKLRSLELEDVLENGLADADFVSIEQGVLTEKYLVGKALRASDGDYHLHAILSPEQQQKYLDGETVKAGMIGWYMIPYADCIKNGDCFPAGEQTINGLIGPPSDKKNPVNEWADQRVELAEDVIYLQLWKEPLTWYWNLLMFLGGIGMAIGVEAWWHRKNRLA